MYFPGRAATIFYRSPPSGKDVLSALNNTIKTALHVQQDIAIGTLGILHPSVLEKFEIGFPCSALEFNLDPFKKQMHKVWTNAD